MFDILGNVFGRSKKGSSGQAGGTSVHTGAPGDEEFVYVQDNNVKDASQTDRPPLYPAIQLTDNMLREGATSSASAPGTWNSHTNVAHPFSSSNVYTSPLDNVPFVPGSLMASTTSNTVDMGAHFSVVDRVSTFLSSQVSQYNFDVEQSVLRESTA